MCRSFGVEKHENCCLMLINFFCCIDLLMIEIIEFLQVTLN